MYEWIYIYIDVLRILSTIAIIVLHGTAFGIQVENQIFYKFLGLNLITRTAVPIFFMISGAMLISKYKDIASDKFMILYYQLKKIVLPFIMVGIIYEIYSIFHDGANVTVLSIVKDFVTNNVHYHLWFVYTLVSIYFLLPIISNINFNERLGKYILIMFLIISTIKTVSYFFYSYNPWWLFVISPELFFFISGYIIHKVYNPIIKIWKVLLLIIFGYLGAGYFVYISSIEVKNLVEFYYSSSSIFIVLSSLLLF